MAFLVRKYLCGIALGAVALVVGVPTKSHAQNCSAPGVVCKSGSLSASETWTPANIYVITGTVTVPSGVVLTVNAGTVVKFDVFSGLGLTVAGTLNVNGTSGSKVYFTSLRDDTLGGDTNGDGSTSTPAAGYWDRIFFNGGTGTLTHAEVRYAGSTSPNYAAIYLSGSSPTLANVTVVSARGAAVSAAASDAPVISGFAASNTPVGGLEIRGGTLSSNATWNLTGIVYVLTGTLTVNSGATLTIAAGTVLKFEVFSSVGLTVVGTLNVNGTSGSKVYFTSLRDDTLGGDTNGDGSTSTPAAGYWDRIFFNGGTGTLTHAEVRYAGSTSPNYAAIYLSGSSPTLANVTVVSARGAAVSAAASDAPVISGFAASNTPVGGLEIRGGTLSSNATWNLTGIVYVLTGTLTVNSGATLTIAAGTVLKFEVFSSVGLTVVGTLNVNGTSGSKVYFTSLRDDTLGGDTNGDGSTSTPAAGYWDRIFFNGGTGTLTHAEVRYAGSTSPNYAAIYLSGSSPTLANVTVVSARGAAVSAAASDAPVISGFAASNTPVGGLEIRGGTLSSNATWNLTGIVYVLTGTLTVNSGATLTIAAGTVLKFEVFSSVGLTVVGTLNVNGTSGSKVYFTSLRDDTLGGDTNGDGSTSTPAAGYWDRIFFNGGTGTVNYADVRYGGSRSPNREQILIQDGSPTLTRCDLHHSAGSAVMISASTKDTRPLITHSSIHDNQVGVRVSGNNANPTIQSNDIFNNSEYGVFNAASGHFITATNNWWGANSGPYDPASSGGDGDYNEAGKGDRVTDYVTYRPFAILPMSIDRSSLTFAAVSNGAALVSQTPPQTVHLTEITPGTVTWTAVSDRPWLQVTPASGSGSGELRVSVSFAGTLPVSGSVTGVVMLELTGPTNTVGPVNLAVNVTLTVRSTSAPASAPFGVLDTPVGDATVLAGSIAVTGWSLDDIGVKRVELWRDLQPGETTTPFASTPTDPRTGKAFISDATFVDGARPDVEALYPTTPLKYRAGWGYLLLTWGLWNQGNGTYKLHAFAFDEEGNLSTIGSKTVIVSNNTATKPFGSIDTPAIGGIASGPNFGWGLTPKVNGVATCKIQPSGVQVSIDSGPLQAVIYGDARSDIAGALPGFSNSAAAGGHYIFDWSTLSNGAHTIGWLITDDCNRADGVGSRFFTVQNATSLTSSETAEALARSQGPSGASIAAAQMSAPPAAEAVLLSRGYGQLGSVLEPDDNGVREAVMDQGERIELRLPREYDVAYQTVNDVRRGLPIGSTWDRASATFYWQPAAGFLGRYEFVFGRSDGTTASPLRIAVVVKPQRR